MRVACLLMLLLAGCSGAEPGPGDAGSHASAWLKACAAVQKPPGMSTIAAAVERLNELPRPVTVACFVAGLPRPLDLVGTFSVTSAQPAPRRDSPRIFVLLPGLVVSVVPAGESAGLLEFSQWITPTRTLKGEVKLPLDAALAADAP